MSDSSRVGGGAWDADSYGRSFGFIAKLGEDLIELVAPKPGERILDLGCGTGRHVAALAARGVEAIGLDSDAAMVKAAKAANPGLKFIRASGEGFRLDHPVDAILSNAALHWMTRPQRAINAMARALRPGGRLVLEMGGHGNVAVLVEAIHAALMEAGVAREALPMPWYFPRLGEYTGRLEKGGFEVDQAILFDRPTPLDDLKGGLTEWLAMFGRPFLAALPPDRHAAVVERVVEITRPRLLREGRWIADYRRLRVVAHRPG